MARLSQVTGAMLGLSVLAACNGDGPTVPRADGCEDGIGQVVDLEPGGVFVGLSAESARCVELVQGSGRYVIAVINTSTSPSAQASFSLRGNGGTMAAADAAAIAGPAPRILTPQALFGPRDALTYELEHRAAHRDLLQQNLRLLRSIPQRRSSTLPNVAASPSPIAAHSVSPEIGAISQLNIVDLDDQQATLCSELGFETISARTVYSGPSTIIVEDVTAPLAGQMDAQFVQMGQEFEQNMLPILTQNFGNPLRLNPGGRLVMVFSPMVNNFERNVAGFVISCDFASQTSVPASNEGEFFYAIVPTSAGTGFDGLTQLNWRRLMRSTLIHEVKHITSFAERLDRGNPFEEAWLEEATAMIAEELWARTIYGVAWKGNVTYQQSVYCDVRPTFPECQDAPLVMFSHFFLLYRYLERPEELSLLGDPPGEQGATFYGSGWSFVRWAIDQYATSESAFLLPLTQGPQTGLANVQARTNRTSPEMLGLWSLANAVDDRQGFTTQVQQVLHPSWDYRNMYQRLRADLPNVFGRQYPLVPRAVTFGDFSQIVTALQGGSAAFFELSGSGVPVQVIELRNVQGGAPPATLRMAVVRVQ